MSKKKYQAKKPNGNRPSAKLAQDRPVAAEPLNAVTPAPEKKAAPAAAAVKDTSTRLNIDFIGKRRVYYTISISLIVIGILISVIFGVKLNIQFKGGAIIKYPYSGTMSASDKSTALSLAKTELKTDMSIQNDTVNAANTKYLIFETTGTNSFSSTQIQTLTGKLQDQFPSLSIKEPATQNVDPSMGRQFFTKSIGEVLLASALIIIYIWIRFRKIGGLPAGITAFIALIHDVLMAFVAFSIFRIPIDENFIAVALTILGYSINDTIVVYDRIRENRMIYGTKMHFKEIVNKSINQSFARSINTTLVTFVAITVVCVFSLVYHLESIRSFALPMMVGVVTGCYSTICIAGPLWVTWVNYKEKKNPPRVTGKKLSAGKA